jgi:DNA-binding NarL/FixJ family response regulator
MNISYTIHQSVDAKAPINLPSAQGCQLLGRFDLDQSSVERAAKLGPTVMVVEIELLALGQVAATLGRMRAAAPLSRLMVIGESGAAAMAQLAVASGAAAYLTRDRSPAVLLSALQEVAKGKWYLSGTGKRAAVNLLTLQA